MEKLTDLFGDVNSTKSSKNVDENENFVDFDDFLLESDYSDDNNGRSEEQDGDLLFNGETCVELPEKLEPEKFYGNVEYKRQLIKPTKHRLTHLTTQMQFRLTEGNGECRYLIGVNDNGSFFGLTSNQLNETIRIINLMAQNLNAETSILRKKFLGQSKNLQCVEILVRQVQNQSIVCHQQPIAILGNADAGKSTLVGVVTTGELDNGKGKSRLQMFRHPHEISSGKTSSVSIDFLGFNATGPLRSTQFRNKDELLKNSTKIIEFWDLAGDARYMKTTVYGLTSCSPNYCILTISGNKGILGTTQEHLLISKALNLSIIIVVTKTDLCSKAQLAETVKMIESTVGAIPFSFIPMIVDTNDKVVNVSARLNQPKTSILPIFLTSSVTGQGLDLLTNFLSLLPTKKFDEVDRLKPVNFQIDTFWYQEANLSTKRLVKVHGRLLSGVIKTGEVLRVGPNGEGKFFDARVENIKRNDLKVRSIEAGQLATLRIFVPRSLHLRKGTYMISDKDQEVCCFEFLAEVKLMRQRLSESSDCLASPSISPKEQIFRVGQTVVCHVANIRQTVLVKEILSPEGKRVNRLETERPGMVKFKFINYPELIQPNSSILFRDSGTRGSGVIKAIFPVRC